LISTSSELVVKPSNYGAISDDRIAIASEDSLVEGGFNSDAG